METQRSLQGGTCWVALDKRGLGEQGMAALRRARKDGMSVSAFLETINPLHPAQEEHAHYVYRSGIEEAEAAAREAATADADDQFTNLSVAQVFEEGLSLYARPPYSS